jgi:hypothetical protein
MSDARPELFYEIAHAGSAAARRVVVARGLLERVRFRNLYYPEVRADYEARGGSRLPALWDGARLVEGEAEVVAALEALA